MEEQNNRLVPALKALSNSLTIQAKSINSLAVADFSRERPVLEGEYIERDISSKDAMNAFERIEEALNAQTAILSEMLGIQKTEIAEAERADRFADVTDTGDDTSSEETNKLLEGFKKAIGGIGNSLKEAKGRLGKGLLGALALSGLPSFVEGVMESLFGEETAQKVKDALDSVLTSTTIGAGLIGFLFGGLRGGLLGLIWGALFTAISGGMDNLFGVIETYINKGIDKFNELFGTEIENIEFPESVSKAIGATLATIGVALMTKSGRDIARKILKRAPTTLPDTQMPPQGQTTRGPRTGRGGMGGMGACCCPGGPGTGTGTGPGGAGGEGGDKDNKNKDKQNRRQPRGGGGRNRFGRLFDVAKRLIVPAVAVTGAVVAGDAVMDNMSAGDTPGKAGGGSPENEGRASNQVSSEQKAKVTAMSDADLADKGVTRTVDKRGRVQYRDTSTGKFVGQADVASRNSAGMVDKAASKFPRFGSLAKALGPLGFGLALADIASILMDDSLSEEERNLALARSVATIIGGAGGATAGAALGTLLFPGPGSLIGGILGGVSGALAADAIASAVGPWLMGENPDDSEIKALVEEGKKGPRGRKSKYSNTAPAMESNALEEIQVTAQRISPSASTVDTGMIKAQRIESGSTLAGGGGGGVIAPVVNSGGNVVNNTGGNSSSTTINIMQPASKALSNAVPIPMSSSSWG